MQQVADRIPLALNASCSNDPTGLFRAIDVGDGRGDFVLQNVKFGVCVHVNGTSLSFRKACNTKARSGRLQFRAVQHGAESVLESSSS